MAKALSEFERIVRAAKKFTVAAPVEEPEATLHAFDRRNIHPNLPPKVRKLFDNADYAEATFTAFKYLDKLVQAHSKLTLTGEKLMMAAFDQGDPKIRLTELLNQSQIDEQRGFRFVFSGGVVGIRNPRGHEIEEDDVDTCLDHLSFVSMLIRRMEQAGYILLHA